MSLSDKIGCGEAAVKEVKNAGILADNKLGDRLKAAQGIETVIAARQGFDSTANDGLKRTRACPPTHLAIENLIAYAEHTKRTRYGNCFEQAVIAFVSLYEKGVRPIDLMEFDNDDQGYDHVWVVIGLHAGWQPDNLRSWGQEAVWCDPWQAEGVVFPVDDLVKGKVRNLSWIYKCNTAELVEAGNARSRFRVE